MTATDTRTAIARVCYDYLLAAADAHVTVRDAARDLSLAVGMAGRLVPSDELTASTMATIAREIDRRVEAVDREFADDPGHSHPDLTETRQYFTVSAAECFENTGADAIEIAAVVAEAVVCIVMAQPTDPRPVAAHLRDVARMLDEDRLKAAAATRTPTVH